MDKTFTQEELNSIVSERLNKEKDKYSTQISELEKKTSEYESQIATLTSQNKELNERATAHKAELDERDAKLKRYETQAVKVRVAREFGIGYELADRLSGDTEDDIRKDAEVMSNLLKSQKPAQPLAAAGDDAKVDPKDDALRKLASQLNK